MTMRCLFLYLDTASVSQQNPKILFARGGDLTYRLRTGESRDAERVSTVPTAGWFNP